jgi:RHS repeat-associated protein
VDALGRVVRVDEPDANGSLGEFDAPKQATDYYYNTQGNLVRIEQGAGVQKRYFEYDALGRLTYERQVEQAGSITITDPATGGALTDPVSGCNAWSRKLVYDETVGGANYSGLLTSAFDARGISTKMKYDNLNRPTSITYSDGVTPEVSYYYDLNRFPDTGSPGTVYDKCHMTEVQTASIGSVPSTSQAYNYDLMGRTIQHRQTVGSYVYSMSYSYNLGGALTSEVYPSGRVVSYAYDIAARLSQVSSGGTTYAGGFVFGSNGLLASYNLGNGAVETFGYNSRLQLTSIDLAKSGTQLQHYDYKYGVYKPTGQTPDTIAVDETKNNGQIAQIDAKIGGQGQWTQKFEYDSLGRLSSARENYGVDNTRSYLVNYDYDLFGNRKQKQSRNANNPFMQKWVEDGDVTQTTNRYASGITYDDAGNVTRDERFHNLKFQYDANNRQRWSANLDGSGAVTAVFDGTGQRVATMSGTDFINISVYDGASQLVAEYGQASSGGGTQYLLSDHQGTPRVVTTSTGTVVSRHDYLPFGEDLGAGIGMRTGVGAGGQQYGATDGVRQKYAGMENDYATGMDHTLWRKYDSASGRWTTPDPYGGSMDVASPQSFNRYSYVNNDPVNKVDLLGLMLSDIGVYQTENPAVVDALERKMLAMFRAATTPPPRQQHPFQGPSIGRMYQPRSNSSHSTVSVSASVRSNVTLVRFNVRDDSTDGKHQVTRYPYMNSLVADAFDEALREINESGAGPVGFTEMFRTSEHQKELLADYQKRVKNHQQRSRLGQFLHSVGLPADPVGESAHEAGVAFDLALNNSSPYGPDQIMAIKGIFEKHGFVPGVPGDPVHFVWDAWLNATLLQRRTLVADTQEAYRSLAEH